MIGKVWLLPQHVRVRRTRNSILHSLTCPMSHVPCADPTREKRTKHFWLSQVIRATAATLIPHPVFKELKSSCRLNKRREGGKEKGLGGFGEVCLQLHSGERKSWGSPAALHCYTPKNNQIREHCEAHWK